MSMFFRRTASAVALLASLAITSPVRAAEDSVHLFTGNPSGATAERAKADNYLLRKKQYALSYNNAHGTANWVSWQLSKAWLGGARRRDETANWVNWAGERGPGKWGSRRGGRNRRGGRRVDEPP